MITDEQLVELNEWAECEGTEWGETVIDLIRMHDYRTYCSDAFNTAVEKEITRFYKDGKKHASFVEREETITRTVREFVWDQ